MIRRPDNEVMVIIALVLIVIVAVFVLAVVLSSRAPVSLDQAGSINLSVFGADLPVSQLGLVCAGAGAMLVLGIAVLLLRVGARRARANRKYQKTLRKNGAGGASKADAPRPVTATSDRAVASGTSPTSTGSSTGSTTAARLTTRRCWTRSTS